MASLPSPSTKLDLLTLFKEYIDTSKDTTRASLRLISDPEKNGNTIEYVQIWTSLACLLSQQGRPDIYLLEPGLPVFVINQHKTQNIWWETIYRSICVIHIYYTEFKTWFQTHKQQQKTWPIATIDEEVLKTKVLNLEYIIGCHRVVQHVLLTSLTPLIQEDIGYTVEDCQYDISKMQMITLFLKGLSKEQKEDDTKSLELTRVNYFQSALTIYNTLEFEDDDDIFLFKEVTQRCIYVLIGIHLYTSKKQYILSEKLFLIAVNEYHWLDMMNWTLKAEKSKKQSITPQLELSASIDDICEKELTLYNDSTNQTTTIIIEGINPFTVFPFHYLPYEQFPVYVVSS